MNKHNKYIMRVLSLLLLATIAFLFPACEDDEAGSDQVILLSFGPAGVQHGEEISVIGSNLNRVTAIAFTGAEVPASQFVSQSGDLIVVVVPEAAEAGTITLKTPQGDIVSISEISFDVLVTIESITSEARPGENITIAGQYVNWIETITFPGGLVVEKADFVSQGVDELVVTVPAEAKTGILKFTSGGTEPQSFDSETQLTVTLPVATTLTPTSIKHEENLTVEGTDLDLVTKITFPGGGEVLKSAFVSQSATQIVVKVPGTSTNGKLSLEVASGEVVESAQAITIILPNVTAFNPSDPGQHTGGNTLIMVGTNLDLVKSITFPGVSTAVTTFTKTPTQITVTIPNNVIGGTVILVTIHEFSVPVAVAFGDQLTLLKVIYDDAAQSPFGAGGGWGGATSDPNSTENPRVGSKSVKTVLAGGWSGGSQFGNWSGQSLSTAGTTYFAFSVFGGPGTEGNQLLVNISGGGQAIVVLEEGKWKDVKILLTSLGNPASISEVSFQDNNWSGTIYVDQIGLK